ncbi:MAG: dihydropteroate synthase [Azospirillaceae bacterium]
MTDSAIDRGPARAGDATGEAAAAGLYLRPLTPEPGPLPAPGRWLAGGPFAFDRVEAITRDGDRVARRRLDLDALARWAEAEGIAEAVAARLDALSRPRAPIPGVPADRPAIMGVVNVTPDSFSDGGDFIEAEAAIAQARALRAAGADILDIGGESTRPGAEPVDPDAEAERVLPVVAALAGEGAVVSIDTRHAAVMRRAVAAGAAIINDVTALTGDPDSLAAAAAAGVPVILMHMRGEPRTMQADPTYVDAPTDVHAALEARVAAAEGAGIPCDRLVVDPGVGFGKTVAHNAELLRAAALFHGLGCPLLIGVSRKSFIGKLSRGEPAKERVPGSLAAGLAGLDAGAQLLRVHDVAETAQAIAVWRAVRGV